MVSSKTVRAKNGKYMGAYAPIGYKKNPDNPGSFIIDEGAAPLVRRIYSMCIIGYGVDQIGGVLEKEKVLTPLNYAKENHNDRGGKRCHKNPFCWNATSISKILSAQEYLGDVINFKTYSKSYKDKKRRRNASENQMVFEGVHEPIIDRETWDKVQAKRGRVRSRKASTGERSVFSGLLVCSTCGANLNFHFNQKNHDIKYFNCNNYNNRGSTCDATHYIRVDFLERILLSELRRITYYAQNYEEEFVKLVLDSALREMEKSGRNRQNSFVLKETKRGSGRATLYCTGRDIEYREIELVQDKLSHCWHLESDSLENPSALLDDMVRVFAEFISAEKKFTGSPTELAQKIHDHTGHSFTAAALSKKLLQSQRELAEMGIAYSTKAGNGKRTVTAVYSDGSVGSYGKTDMSPTPKTAVSAVTAVTDRG